MLFLGTGGDSTVIGKSIRTAGGFYIRVDNTSLLIDPGPGALVSANRTGISLRELTAVIATHNHINHCSDSNALINAMTHAGLDRRGVFMGSTSVVNGTEDTGPILTSFHKTCVEKVITLEPEKNVGVNDFEIRSLKTEHGDPTCVGLKIFTPAFVLGYTSDTSITKEIISQYKQCDVLVLNVQLPNEQKKPGNMNTHDAIKIIKETKPKLAVITHFGIKMINADPIDQVRSIQRECKVDCIAATDNLSIKPSSYAAKLGTKTLNLYK